MASISIPHHQSQDCVVLHMSTGILHHSNKERQERFELGCLNAETKLADLCALLFWRDFATITASELVTVTCAWEEEYKTSGQDWRKSPAYGLHALGQIQYGRYIF